MKPQTKSLIEINVATVLLGAVGLFAKLITLPAPVIIYGRTLVAFIALFVLARVVRASLTLKSRHEIMVMIGLGASSLVQWVFFFKAIQASTVSLAVVIFTCYPIFICFLEPWLNRQKVKPTDLFIAMVILVAVYVAAPGFTWSEDSNRGAIFAVIAGFGQATNIALKRRFASGKFHSVTISFYEHMIANLMLLPMLPFIVSNFDWSKLDAHNIGLLVLLGLGFSALTRYLVAQSLTHLTARSVGFVATLEPIYAIVFAGLMLNEVPAATTLVGGAMIIAAIVSRMVFFGSVPQPPQQAPAPDLPNRRVPVV